MGRPLGAGTDREIRWETIDVPEATGGSGLGGINAAGDVVGFFADATGTHGFVRRQSARIGDSDVDGYSARGLAIRILDVRFPFAHFRRAGRPLSMGDR